MSSSTETYHGSCLCSSIKIVLDGAPIKCAACHCLDCQKSAGGPYQISAIYSTSNVQVLDPQDHLTKYSVPGESLESGFEKHKYFCGKCGSPLFNRSMRHKGELTIIKAGILDPPQVEGQKSRSGVSLFKPTLEVFTKDRPSFIGCIDDAEQLNGGLPPQ